MSTEYMDDVKRYAPSANDKAVAGIVKHLGIALKSKDASLVSCSSKDELARVRDSWCKKKLGLTDDAAVDAAIKDICETMKGDKQKHRVTFYYLLAEKLGKVDMLTD
jgi:3-dehydroquinate synthetase